MAVNPNARIEIQNGQLQPALNLGTDIVLKLGVSTGGPLLRALRKSETSGVLQYLHGPLVASAAHHVTYSGDAYLMRIRASSNGSIGSVSKLPAAGLPGSYGSIATALSSYELHGTIDTVAAAATGTFATAAASGWTAPSAPLPVTVTSGVGTVAHVQTFTYIDDAGDVKTGTLSISAAGTATTSFAVAQILSITADVAPVGTQDYDAAFVSPADRYPVRVVCDQGGVVGVTGGTLPRIKVSLDDGQTYSRVQALPSTGVLELLSYAGGLRAQATGVTLTVSNGTALGGEVFGSLRVAGATTPGDIVFTKKTSNAVTVAVVVSGMNTAFSIGVVGNAITINSATNGGGTATTTATTAADAINAHATASQLVTAVAVGAGTGVLAAAASAGFANSSVSYVPKVEGVQVRHINPGASNVAISISVSGKQISVSPITDANGAQTSTAAQVETAVNAHAAASLLVVADASGSGAGIVGMQGSFQALAVTMATGDAWTFATTPPTWTNADLEEAFVEIAKNEALLDVFGVIHVVGEAGEIDVASTDAFLATLAEDKKRWKSAVLEAGFMGSTSESTWSSGLISTHATHSNLLGLCAGEINTRNPAYGTIDRRNIGTTYVARLMTCPVSELPSHPNCETFKGIKTSLDGVLVRTSTASATVTPLWQTEDVLKTLNAANFVTLRVWPGRSGVYVRQGLTFAEDDADDFLYVTNRRTADLVLPYAYDEILGFLNSNLLTDLETGRLAQVEINKIQDKVEERVRKGAMSGDRQHIGGVKCTLDTEIDYAGTGLISGALTVVGRTPATEIVLKFGYSKTLQ